MFKFLNTLNVAKGEGGGGGRDQGESVTICCHGHGGCVVFRADYLNEV